MLTNLADATRSRCGAKAATLAVLLRAGIAVPEGFVVPRDEESEEEPGPALRAAIARELERLGDPLAAVRSSATDEDAAEASAAGQYESVIGVRGADEVCDAVATCRRSARADRVREYRRRTARPGAAAPGMAVLVQRLVAADASGVMFTPQQPGEPTRIEASWGLGLAVVDGSVDPDAYEVAADGGIASAPGRKALRTDAAPGGGTVTQAVAPALRAERALDEAMVSTLAELGHRIAALLGGPQDVEWATVDGQFRILQARPVTAPLLPAAPARTPARSDAILAGTPGSRGTATAIARVVRGPADFAAVRPGEILVCPSTDPAWTPLFAVAGGIVTETGGALSHAAIVAREYALPAVLGVEGALARIRDGDRIAVDGAAGTVAIRPHAR
ncbi:PEP/pyruvate-binding domain-containing protein [Gulosibacter sp. 10]|uniref:PEP/pyruvate-binding domain-containing protein n=1 Tax=Gulosibacter sp. 10 TaxID=1255570 RepID=UPI00097F1C7C|nr:PEP/pyruvate-binding domain-containing protein [Gulosibacter sp. 10]SJM71550.1 Phosphoenolpyruvate synthase [Gulosibacter sp. 10]